MSEEKKHYATTESSSDTYQVFYKRELILESDHVVKLNEHYNGKDFPPVIYFPESEIQKLETSGSELSTHCPIKGDASYRSFKDSENGIWTYNGPVESVSEIKNHFAFDQKKGFRVTQKL